MYFYLWCFSDPTLRSKTTWNTSINVWSTTDHNWSSRDKKTLPNVALITSWSTSPSHPPRPPPSLPPPPPRCRPPSSAASRGATLEPFYSSSLRPRTAPWREETPTQTNRPGHTEPAESHKTGNKAKQERTAGQKTGLLALSHHHHRPVQQEDQQAAGERPGRGHHASRRPGPQPARRGGPRVKEDDQGEISHLKPSSFIIFPSFTLDNSNL